jgi:hypothetical protein
LGKKSCFTVVIFRFGKDIFSKKEQLQRCERYLFYSFKKIHSDIEKTFPLREQMLQHEKNNSPAFKKTPALIKISSPRVITFQHREKYLLLESKHY